MTFPKSKSRTLTLDGRTYHWTLSPLEDFAMQLRVSAGGSQLSHVIEAYSLSAVAVKPRFVAAMIRHGLAAGWQPELSGPEFRLKLPSEPKDYVTHEGATRPGRYENVYDVPATGSLLCCRIDIEPLREQWPWEHHRNVFVNFRVWGGVNERAIGSFMANLVSPASIIPEQDAELNLRALARSDPYEWSLPGGVQFWQDGRLRMDHGCCARLSEWVEWRLDYGEYLGPWNGHDPHSSAQRDADRIDFYEEYDKSCASLELQAYERCLDLLRQDLKDFTVTVREWVRLRCDQATARRIAAMLAERLHLK